MNDVFPFEWKRAKVVSVQKKGNKQLLTNYQTILWQPISDKNFELLQFSEMYEFFMKIIYYYQDSTQETFVLINKYLSPKTYK